jgi:DNA-binding transcriptional MocR family regulator
MGFAQKRGVIYVDGSAFFVDGTGREFMRLSFSAPSPDRIEEGVSRLAQAIGDATTARATASAQTEVGPMP